MKLRYLAAALVAVPIAACAQSLTLTNLKGPIAKACGTTQAKSIAELWAQINGCSRPAPTPSPTPAPTPTPTPSGKPITLFIGDSISVFWAGNHTGIYAAAHPELDVRSEAVGGSGVAQVTGDRLKADLTTNADRIVIFFGANDLASYPSETAWWAAEKALGAQFEVQGKKVFYGTVLQQCGATEHNRRATAINATIRAEKPYIDYAAQPGLADPCDKNVFSDGVHPLDVTAGRVDGQGLLSAADKAALDGVASTPTPAPNTDPQATKVASGLDVQSLLQPAWGTGAIPDHDVDVGAFRFICAPGQVNWDDPIVYPGQKAGSPHPHQWFGNAFGNYASTYASLRTTGDSTCNNALNRSGYWVQVMMHPSGKMVVPDWFAIYYKRMPASDPRCQIAAKACIEMPRGLRFVFGYNMSSPAKSDPAVWRWWNCPDSPTSGHYATIREAAQGCPVGHQIEFAINSPDCWNGTQLDSADHRSHMAYRIYDGVHSYPVCPAGYPYIVPQITEEGFYTTDALVADWYLYADKMPGMTAVAGGTTLHTDWFGAWEDSILDRWTANCIDKLLSCSGGDLGDGQQIKTTNGYSYPTGLKLVDLPTRPN